VISTLPDSAPTHVRHRKRRRWLQFVRDAGNDAKAFDVFFLGSVAKQLHAETDSEHGLFESAYHVNKLCFPQSLHRVFCGSYARQQNAFGRADRFRVGRQLGVDTQALESKKQRRDIGAATVDNCDRTRAQASVPLVDGISVPLRSNAWRKVRPTALKQASTM